MRIPIALALLVSCPLPVLAEEPSPASASTSGATAPRLDWSIGAGLGWTGISLSSNGFPAGYVNGVNPSAVFATASLERRLAPRTWLVFGVNGTFDHSTYSLPPGAAGFTSLDAFQIGLAAGVRQVLTAPTSPVEVSIIGLLEGGVGSWSATWTSSTLAGQLESQTDWFVGASGGLAVDRELTSGLSLRVGTPILALRWSSIQARFVGQSETTGSSFGVALRIAPYLELRLAF
jgi:hypothetical protein